MVGSCYLVKWWRSACQIYFLVYFDSQIWSAVTICTLLHKINLSKVTLKRWQLLCLRGGTVLNTVVYISERLLRQLKTLYLGRIFFLLNEVTRLGLNVEV